MVLCRALPPHIHRMDCDRWPHAPHLIQRPHSHFFEHCVRGRGCELLAPPSAVPHRHHLGRPFRVLGLSLPLALVGLDGHSQNSAFLEIFFPATVATLTIDIHTMRKVYLLFETQQVFFPYNHYLVRKLYPCFYTKISQKDFYY